jgi:uncharacterized membrane protein YeaQ/YmgE (transglycosylase-associated protein family)
MSPLGREKEEAIMNFLYFAIVGIIAGWLAGQIMKGRGFGLIGNLVIGVLGAMIGGWLFGFLGLSAYGLIGSILMAVFGAVVLLFLVGLVKKAA